MDTIKKQITPAIITIFIWGIGLLLVNEYYYEYIRYYQYIFIPIMISFMIFNLVKQRRDDKADGTQSFKFSIYNILVTLFIMGVLFFLIKSN